MLVDTIIHTANIQRHNTYYNHIFSNLSHTILFNSTRIVHLSFNLSQTNQSMSKPINDILQSKLVELLITLRPDEFKDLQRFVMSPIHNRRSKVSDLINILAPYYPRFDGPELSRQFLHQQLFRTTTFNDLEIRRTMSQLAVVTEDFLAWKEYNQKPSNVAVHKLSALRKRGLQKHFDKTTRDTQQLLSQQHTDLNQQLFLFQFEQEQEAFAEQLGARRSTTHIQEVSDRLDHFYMANKLKLACTAVSYQQVFKHQYDIKLTNEVLALLAQTEQADPLVNLYRFGLLTMTEPENENHFQQLKTLLQQDLNIEPKEERNIHVLGQNFCIRNVNRGQQQYFNELFELYKLGLQKGVIQSELSQFAPAFKNIVSTGLRVRQFDWVESFINTYSELLDKKNRSDFRNYNMARLRFDQERFQEAKTLLQEVRFKDVFITLNARVLLIKTFYELDQLDLAEHQLRNTQNFVSRQKNLSYHADIFKKNLRFLSKLLRVNLSDTKETKALTTEISEQKGLTETRWLLSKLEQA